MPKFIALTSQGLGEIVADEIKDLELKVLKKTPSQVIFESNWRGCYRANLHLRSANRILLSILDFYAHNSDELYNGIRKHDFTKYIKPHQTLCVYASVSQSLAFKNSNFVNQKVKDAVVDQFHEKFGTRPSVDKKNADLNIYLRIHKQQVNVAIDTTGKSLSHRGYRKDQGLAPLRESLAAGLLGFTNLEEASLVVDPMCGSGTLLIEAALKHLKQTPGLISLQKGIRPSFCFQRWLIYQPEGFRSEYEQVTQKDQQRPSRTIQFRGFDVDPRAIKAARQNAQRAGLEGVIEFKQKSLKDWQRTENPEPALVLVNPPYGERLGFEKRIQDIYQELSRVLKHNFKGSQVWLLSGSKDLSLGMKAKVKYPIMNSGIECRWLNYEIY